ncbi:MAG: SAM-dependent chlorinase/fluorinase [Candidatus Levybacteria bacterium]|nr:SAM-dependent chlorinase/fluorinase [Candidatus Levybacteria bacterium]MBI2189924.1 SAM-dependent chlorinase/fluorinase [Candidatus Levybacteria bacterium]MBI3070097.1 SAM-dependent chlorinase/fluorinase [Candidatus Levybacteria bacterium]MBI3092809.1 SAM-dependent chlorinase/fluorinase [Candidatus Levybacteria bacterium]
MKSSTLIIISDYGVGDPAFTEVILQLKILLPNVFIYPQSTPPFSTINTGFWIYQIAQTPNLKNTYIYSNTAPRKDDKSAQKNNKGEKLMYARLNNGFEIMAVNSGYVFSFVKPHVQKFHYVNVKNEGSQFRSRDLFPKAVAKMVIADKAFLGEKEKAGVIPNYPQNVICAIDGYGNIKTTTQASQINLSPGQTVTITINKQKHTATYSDGVFNIKDGELVFAPGSSGHNDRFMEIFVRGGSAYRLFDRPNVEDEFIVI